jgi:hypothetical protein
MSWDAHLKENGMSYRQHFFFAASHACECWATACKLLVHAICPWIWERAGQQLARRMLRDFRVADNNY